MCVSMSVSVCVGVCVCVCVWPLVLAVHLTAGTLIHSLSPPPALAFLPLLLLLTRARVCSVQRLDVTSLPQGYQGYDTSHFVYVSVVLVDFYYSNAVVITFVRYGAASGCLS